jgi:hypothetical protein
MVIQIRDLRLGIRDALVRDSLSGRQVNESRVTNAVSASDFFID